MQYSFISSHLNNLSIFHLYQASVMEPISSNDLIFTMLSKHLYSTFLPFLHRLLTLILVLSIEAYFIAQDLKLTFHFMFLCSITLLHIIIKWYSHSKSATVYLVDFLCFKPPNYCRVPFTSFIENTSKIKAYDDETLAFMSKILTASGQSEETYLPPALHYIPPKTQHREAIKEAEMVLFPIMDDLLTKTKLSPQEIDILIVNCSGFCPSPSLTSIIINKYSMRTDVQSYNLSGMGCSASAIGIELAQNLLKTRKNSYAILLSTEILSNGWYAGHEKPKLVLNCLFRMGSAAILLTNKTNTKHPSKYKLITAIRTQKANEDKAYKSVIREEDSNGHLGVTINKDLIQVAREILTTNITILGSRILPIKEKLHHGFSIIKTGDIYVPNFRTAVNHFCLPTSGKPLIKDIARGLKLNDTETEPALMTLHRFGNQSSSSLWYELSYIESKQRMKIGDRVWQLGMGTGPKCCSLVWECIRPIDVIESSLSPWAESIHKYPILDI